MEAAAHLESVEKCDMSDSEEDEPPTRQSIKTEYKSSNRERTQDHQLQQQQQQQQSLNFDAPLVDTSSLSQLHFQNTQMIPSNNSLKLYHDYTNSM